MIVEICYYCEGRRAKSQRTPIYSKIRIVSCHHHSQVESLNLFFHAVKTGGIIKQVVSYCIFCAHCVLSGIIPDSGTVYTVYNQSPYLENAAVSILYSGHTVSICL